jgi:hypothetical protein
MSDGTVTYSAADNGLNIPPSTFTRSIEYPTTIKVVGAGSTFINGDYPLATPSVAGALLQWGSGGSVVRKYLNVSSIEDYTTLDQLYWVAGTGLQPNKTGWNVGDYGMPDAPTLEYDVDFTATVSPKESTATWASSSPDTGFVSLTTTPDADFGYIVTLDFDGGTDAGYNLYFTQGSTDEYRNLPLSSKDNFFMAGWKTVAGERVDNFTKITTAAAHTLSVLWISEYIGAIHNGCRLENGFFLSIGSYVVFSEPASSASEIGLSNPTNKIGISAE